jgi:hypothetical protein
LLLRQHMGVGVGGELVAAMPGHGLNGFHMNARRDQQGQSRMAECVQGPGREPCLSEQAAETARQVPRRHRPTG